MQKFFQGIVICISAISLTALGIDAADTLRGSQTTLLGQLFGADGGECPVGMVVVPAATSFTCVDAYEVSASDACPHKNPQKPGETVVNLAAAGCRADSAPEREPWRYITRDEAQTACLAVGKRLPDNSEWQLIALGTPDNESCQIDARAAREAGSESACRSAVGVFDAVGNLWEWTSDEVIAGTYRGRALPPTGYVSATDSSGIAVSTASSTVVDFNSDYFWAGPAPVRGIMRGGFYGSRSDAGVYSAHADVSPEMASDAIGFRCIR